MPLFTGPVAATAATVIPMAAGADVANVLLVIVNREGFRTPTNTMVNVCEVSDPPTVT